MRRSAPRWLAGSLPCVLVGLALLVSCTENVPAATTPTQPTGSAPGGARQPTPTLGRHGAGDVIGAEISPGVATAGQAVVVTPAAAVTPTCGVTMAFYDPYLWGDRELIGVLLDNRAWVPFDPNVTTTLPPCLPPPASDPVSAQIPGGLDDGLYEACIGAIGSAHGCNLLRVIRPGEIAAGTADAAAAPLVVSPGDEFTVTPATADTRVCSRFELLVGHDGGLELVGFPTRGGDVHFAVPGATTTAPQCDAVAGVPSAPITFVAPDVPAGPYLFCLASRFDPPGCARVTVER